MPTPLSLLARKSRLTALRDTIDSNGGGELWLYTGTPPATPDDYTTETLLAKFALPTVSGSITDSAGVAIYTIPTPLVANALSTGVAGWGRFVNGLEEGVLDRDVVEIPTVGPITMAETQLYTGGEVQIIYCVMRE